MSRERSHGGDPYDMAGATSSPVHPGTKKEETTTPGPPVADPAMFRGVLGDIVNLVEPHTEADPVGILVSLLAAVGVIVGPGPHLKVGSTRHPLLIWPLLFGRTGSGRKGETWEAARLFLLSSYPEASEFIASGLSSGEGLIERIRDPDTGDGDDEKRRKKSPGGTEDKRLLVVEPEFASVMARAKREGSTLAAVLRQTWDGRGVSVLNRTALVASSSHVAIVGHVTPKEFRLRLAESDQAGGTYNRFLPVYVERSKRLPLPSEPHLVAVSEIVERLKKAIVNARSVTRIDLSAESKAWWSDELYDELTSADDEDTAATEFSRRAAPYALRIAGLHAALEGRDGITPPDLAAAVALLRYSAASAEFVLQRQMRDPRVDRIRRGIDASQDGLTRTEISKLFSRNVAAAALDELLVVLVDGGEYERIQVSTGGRPAHRYRRVAPIVSSFFVPGRFAEPESPTCKRCRHDSDEPLVNGLCRSCSYPLGEQEPA